jgi:hypothetical protein
VQSTYRSNLLPVCIHTRYNCRNEIYVIFGFWILEDTDVQAMIFKLPQIFIHKNHMSFLLVMGASWLYIAHA